MKIETRNFGSMEIDLAEVITFRLPLLGFEEQREFVLLSDSTVGDCFLWLQSIHDRETCFILVDPQVLGRPYTPELPAEILRQLELKNAEQAVVRLVAVVPEQFTEATVNLKSPIVVNTLRHTAGQVVLDEDYPIRAPLMDTGEGESSC